MVLFKGQIKYSELKSCSLWTQMPAFSLSSKLAMYPNRRVRSNFFCNTYVSVNTVTTPEYVLHIFLAFGLLLSFGRGRGRKKELC